MIHAESNTVIAKPIDDVFAFATNPANEPLWHTDIAEARATGTGAIGIGSQVAYRLSRTGGGGRATGEVIAREPQRLQTVRFDRGPMGMRPTITLRFESVAEGIRVTRIVDIQPTGVGRLLAPVFGVLARRRNARFIDNLKRRLEGG